ncbi:MAG TPA: cytochrome c oxidase assembly protein [Acidimicrobiia bacterium]|jgi:putative membrane protein
MPAWHMHWDVVAILGVVGLAYWYFDARIRPHLRPVAVAATRRQRTFYYTGLGLILVVSSWPLHDLAESSLYWVHMVDHMVITLVGPPLMLMGLSRPMSDVVFGNKYVLPWLRQLTRPVAAFAIFNLGMIATHWPAAVALSLQNEFAHFSMHLFLFLSAIILWLPVVSNTPLLPRLRPPVRMGYLFLNSVLPTVPAGFLTFSRRPIYPAYGDGSLAFGLTPLEDQTIAGLIMKLGGTTLIWAVIAVIWFKWATEERRWDEIEQDLRTSV